MAEATALYFKSRLRSKWQLTLPSKVRELLGVKQGDDLVFYLNEQQQVVVDRQKTIPPDQAWFWTEHWQQMEREAQAEIDADRTLEFGDVEDAIKYLNEVGNAKDYSATSIC